MKGEHHRKTNSHLISSICHTSTNNDSSYDLNDHNWRSRTNEKRSELHCNSNVLNYSFSRGRTRSFIKKDSVKEINENEISSRFPKIDMNKTSIFKL